MNDFLKDFDSLLSEILTDYQNQFPEADISQGSLIYIKSACLASALWGLYKYQDYIAQQIFPDSADTPNLEHHVWIRGLSRTTGETDAALLARLLTYIRQPPAGGNKYDYVKWAMEIDGVKAAYCFPLAQGIGTVDVMILAIGDDEIPSQVLLDEVYDYIDDVRPVTASIMRVLAPSKIVQAVTVVVTGESLNLDIISSDIEVYINGLEAGEDLAVSQLISIAIKNDASDVSVTIPAANVEADIDEIIRPGTINVTES